MIFNMIIWKSPLHVCHTKVYYCYGGGGKDCGGGGGWIIFWTLLLLLKRLENLNTADEDEIEEAELLTSVAFFSFKFLITSFKYLFSVSNFLDL